MRKYKIYFTVNDVEDWFIFEQTEGMHDVRGEVMIELEKRGIDVIKNNVRSEII